MTCPITNSAKWEVSIQLVSPASGDPSAVRRCRDSQGGFHSISFPSEWGLDTGNLKLETTGLFPFN